MSKVPFYRELLDQIRMKTARALTLGAVSPEMFQLMTATEGLLEQLIDRIEELEKYCEDL